MGSQRSFQKIATLTFAVALTIGQILKPAVAKQLNLIAQRAAAFLVGEQAFITNLASKS